MSFGWRQLCRNKITSAAAVLSLALGIGSCVAAFRLIDALLWRPLPIANASKLYVLSRKMTGLYGKPAEDRHWATPDFNLMRDAVRTDLKDQADLIAISDADRTDITWAPTTTWRRPTSLMSPATCSRSSALSPRSAACSPPPMTAAPAQSLRGPLLGLLGSPLRPRSPRPWPLPPHRRPDLRNHRRRPARFHRNRKGNGHRHLSAPQHEQRSPPRTDIDWHHIFLMLKPGVNPATASSRSASTSPPSATPSEAECSTSSAA